jgi:phosphoribosylformylglycinamidine synthase
VFVKAKPEYLMSSMAVIKDSSTLTTCDFKLPGDVIYIIGETKDELGASEFYLMNNETGRNVPKSDLRDLKSRFTAMENAIKSGIVNSAQYVSKGGLAAALANSSVGGDLGADITLDNIDDELERADKLLYSETTGRFVITVHESKAKEFEQRMQGHYFKRIGKVRDDSEFNVLYKSKKIIDTGIYKIKEKNKGKIRPGKLLEAA